MATEHYSVIILNQPTQAQRNAVHARVKKATGTWWHAYDDIWIVRSTNQPTQWINLLKGQFATGPAGFLVLGLPDTDQTRSWGYFGPNPNDMVGWLHKNYTQDR